MSARAQFRAFLAESGAVFDTDTGAPTTFGDSPGEIEGAGPRRTIAWCSRDASVRVIGADAASFLHRLLTAAITPMQPGDHTPALLLDTKGKIQASFDLWRDAEAFVAVGDATALDAAVQTLSRYVLRADVRLEPQDHAVFAARAHGAGLQRPGSIDAQWLPAAEDHACVTVPWSGAAEAWRGLVDADFEPVGQRAETAWRIRRGEPAHGAELTGDEFPQEAGLDAAVDFEKGCYLGQETVARIHYRGQVQRVLCRLSAPGELSPGAPLTTRGRTVGAVTSAIEAADGGCVGLGYLRREHAAAGSDIQCAGIAVGVEPVSPATAE